MCIADFFWQEDVDKESSCNSSSNQLLSTHHSKSSLASVHHITSAMPTNFSWNVIHKHLNVLL